MSGPNFTLEGAAPPPHTLAENCHTWKEYTWRNLNVRNISGTAEASVVKFSVLAGYVKMIIPERGVAQVTWSIVEFYTPFNFSGMAEGR